MNNPESINSTLKTQAEVEAKSDANKNLCQTIARKASVLGIQAGEETLFDRVLMAGKHRRFKGEMIELVGNGSLEYARQEIDAALDCTRQLRRMQVEQVVTAAAVEHEKSLAVLDARRIARRSEGAEEIVASTLASMTELEAVKQSGPVPPDAQAQLNQWVDEIKAATLNAGKSMTRRLMKNP